MVKEYRVHTFSPSRVKDVVMWCAIRQLIYPAQRSVLAFVWAALLAKREEMLVGVFD